MKRGLNFFPTPPGATTIEPLGEKRPYVNFDLELTDEEKALFQRFDLSYFGQLEHRFQEFNDYGDTSLLEESLRIYLTKLGQNPPQDIIMAANVMTRISQKALRYFETTHGWICLRPSLPNQDFQLPRWHRDGYFYSPYEDPQAKMVMALKGPPTLFYEATEEQRATMEAYDNAAPKLSPRMTKLKEYRAYQEGVRKQLADKVFDRSHAVTATAGHGTIFTVGKNGAIHSEPDMNVPRLFFSILPGTAEQITEFQERSQAMRSRTI